MSKKLSAVILTLFILSSHPSAALAGESAAVALKPKSKRVQALEAEVRRLNTKIDEIQGTAQRQIDALEYENRSLRDELERIRSVVGGGGARPS